VKSRGRSGRNDRQHGRPLLAGERRPSGDDAGKLLFGRQAPWDVGGARAAIVALPAVTPVTSAVFIAAVTICTCSCT
jgi:hypothetical protein